MVQVAETEATLQTAPLVQAVEVEPRISGEFRPRVVVEARRRSPAQTVVGAAETTQGRAECFSRASLQVDQAGECLILNGGVALGQVMVVGEVEQGPGTLWVSKGSAVVGRATLPAQAVAVVLTNKGS